MPAILFLIGGNDDFVGRGGNDTINGGAGDELIDAGNGNDSVEGGIGDDEIPVLLATTLSLAAMALMLSMVARVAIHF
jgi:Ca2+-binding RTX toxin-like protein